MNISVPKKIEQRPVGDLIPYISNARTHSDEQIAQIAASIKEFGFTNPVLVDGDNGIIAGHGRVLAAQKLGMDKVPCIELAPEYVDVIVRRWQDFTGEKATLESDGHTFDKIAQDRQGKAA